MGKEKLHLRNFAINLNSNEEFNLTNYEDNSKREFALTDEQKRIAYQTVGPVYDWAANYFDRLPPRWTSHHYRYGGIMS